MLLERMDIADTARALSQFKLLLILVLVGVADYCEFVFLLIRYAVILYLFLL